MLSAQAQPPDVFPVETQQQVTPEPTSEPSTKAEPKAQIEKSAEHFDVSRTEILAPNFEIALQQTKSDNVTVAIGIANTAQTEDDLVRKDSTVSCLIRLVSPQGKNVNVRLWCPDSVKKDGDKILFQNGDSSNQLPLTLPGNGSSVAFAIKGVKVSGSVGDTGVRVWKDKVDGPNVIISGSSLKKDVTVWTVNNPQMNVAKGGNYEINAENQSRYIASPLAVYLRGEAKFSPSDVPLQIGILQNFRSTGYSTSLTAPKVIWGNAPKGAKLQPVTTTWALTSSVPNVTNDCLDNAWPFYTNTQPASTGSIHTNDTPGVPMPRPYVIDYVNPSGGSFAKVIYQRYARLNCDARDWVVAYRPPTSSLPREIFRLAESNWSLDINSGASTAQNARVGTSHSVQNSYVLGTATTTANNMLQKNLKKSSTGTTNFPPRP